MISDPQHLSPHRHALPFGAELTDSGVQFRLWAPEAGTVDLLLYEGRAGESTKSFSMEPLDQGWFQLVTDKAGVGSRYRFRIDKDLVVPDPASRFQPDDVLGPSMVVDPDAYSWTTEKWCGRPWHEAVIYELHVGALTSAGSFDALRGHLDDLARLGVTALELMPLADFPGTRNWGYDGVLPFAPDSIYGTPNALKRLIDAAHGAGLMMILDVVYNHFGPQGNFLGNYAPQFFTDRFHTPWGSAIDFGRREVRDFVIHNALYWLEEYRFDGLRLDAVHAIADDSRPDILEELASVVRERFAGERHVHLVLENDDNTAHYLKRDAQGVPELYVAQWNDDIHHAFHVLATGESAGYYRDYCDNPIRHLGRCLSEGFAYQGEASPHRDGEPRGEASAELPLTAFVSFLQNHDQIGNRAMGERLSMLCSPEALRLITAVMLLAPSPPLLFMGEEWGASTPFLFFCDFHDALADAVREGRRGEFRHFPQFRDEVARARIPDPNDTETFRRSKLDWREREGPPHREWLRFHRDLLDLRRCEIVPRLAHLQGRTATWERLADRALCVHWHLDDAHLSLVANLSDEESGIAPRQPAGQLLYATHETLELALAHGRLPPWCGAWFLSELSGQTDER